MREHLPRYLNEVYLMLTEFCPLRCEYCYIKGRDNPVQISMEVVDKSIALFNGRNAEVVFFGGEPLVALDLLEQVFYKYEHQLRFQVVTSALVNFDKFLEFYKRNNSKIKLQISWDGVVTSRRMASGAVRQDEVLDNILRVGEAGLGAQVRCVVNDTNITNWFATYKAFKELRKKYRITGDFTIAHQTSFAPGFDSKIKSELSKILDDIKQDLIEENKVYVPQMLIQYLFNIALNKPGGSCDVGNYIVVRPNGDIYPCTILSQSDTTAFNMGNVLKPNNISTEIVTALKEKPEDCIGCESSAICDGGCRYERYGNFDESWQDKSCSFTCENADALTKVLSKWYNELGDLQVTLLCVLAPQIGLTAAQYAGASIEPIYRQQITDQWK